MCVCVYVGVAWAMKPKKQDGKEGRRQMSQGNRIHAHGSGM